MCWRCPSRWSGRRCRWRQLPGELLHGWESGSFYPQQTARNYGILELEEVSGPQGSPTEQPGTFTQPVVCCAMLCPCSGEPVTPRSSFLPLITSRDGVLTASPGSGELRQTCSCFTIASCRHDACILMRSVRKKVCLFHSPFLNARFLLEVSLQMAGFGSVSSSRVIFYFIGTFRKNFLILQLVLIIFTPTFLEHFLFLASVSVLSLSCSLTATS